MRLPHRRDRRKPFPGETAARGRSLRLGAGRARPRSVIGAVAKVRDVGAYCVTGEKTDNEAETAGTKGKRDLLVCHGDPRIRPRSDEQTASARPRLHNGCAASRENLLAGHSCDKRSSDIAKPGFLGLPLWVTVAGHLSDRIGRKRMYKIGCVVMAVFGFI